MNEEDKESINKTVAKKNIEWLIKITKHELKNARDRVEYLNERLTILEENK